MSSNIMWKTATHRLYHWYNSQIHKRKGVSHMAIVPQQTLFVWSEIENLGDLERLRLVIEYMPDEELMAKLEREEERAG
jgi:hypothetical protein